MQSIGAKVLCNPTIVVLLLALFGTGKVHAQSPSVIYGQALNGGDKVMDPNQDGFVSVTNAGFIGGDIGATYSEIPYRFFPQMGLEPLADLVTGANGGHTDLAEKPLGMFFDGTNLLFRVRLGGNSTASKGYSFLIDSNNQYDNGLVTYTTPSKVVNQGFEYEVAFASNFEVKLYQHAGTGDMGSPAVHTLLWTGDMSKYSQRSVAYTRAGGDPDYFYDFYVPLSAFNGGITAATKLRLSGSTVTSAQSGLIGTISDVGGVDDRLYNNNAKLMWQQIIPNFPPTSLEDLLNGEFGCMLTNAPVLSSPLKSSATTVSGTSSEANGTVIRVYKGGTVSGSTFSGGTLIGTGTVSNSAWSVDVSPALAENEVIRATAISQTPVKCESAASVAQTVIAGTCSTAPISTAIGINNGSKGLNGTYTMPATLSGAANTATFTIYKIMPSGVLSSNPVDVFGAASTTPTTVTYSALSASSPVTWSIGGQTGNSLTNGSFVVTVAVNTGCESAPSGITCVGNGVTAIPTPVLTTTKINKQTIPSPLAGSVPATTATSVVVTIYQNGVSTGQSMTITPVNTTTATAFNFSLSAANLTNISAGDLITVRATGSAGTTTYCASAASTSIPVFNGTTATPQITGAYCKPAAAGTSTLTFTGTLYVNPSASPTVPTDVGAVIKIYNGVTNAALPTTGTVYVNASGLWSATVTADFSAITSIKATATLTGKEESVYSNAATLSAQVSTTTLSNSLLFTIDGTSATQVSNTNPIRQGNGANGAIYGTWPTNGDSVFVYLNKSVLGKSLVSGGRWALTELSQLELFAGGLITAAVKSGACISALKSPSGAFPYDNTTATLQMYDYVQCNTAPTVTGSTYSLSAATVCLNRTIDVTVTNTLSSLYYRVYVNGLARSDFKQGTGGSLVITTYPLNVTGTRTVTVRASAIVTEGCQTEFGTPATLTVNAGTTATKPLISVIAACSGTTATIQVTNALTAAGGSYLLYRNGYLLSTTAAPATGTTLNITVAGPIASTDVFTVEYVTTACAYAISDAFSLTVPNLATRFMTTTPTICSGTGTLNLMTEFGGATAFTYTVLSSFNGGANTTLATLTGDGLLQTITTGTLAAGTYTYTVQVTKAGCTAQTLSTTATITVAQSVTANAGLDKTVCPPSTILAATKPTAGTGLWTVVTKPLGAADPTFSTASAYNTTVSGLVSGAYTFRWTVSTTCPVGTNTALDEMILTVNCATTYTPKPAKYVNTFAVNEVIATASDSEGFTQSGSCTSNNSTGTNAATFTGMNFQYVSPGSSIPPGTTLDCQTGNIYVSNTAALVAGTYDVIIRSLDSKGAYTNVPVRMTFYPAASSRAIVALPVEMVYFYGRANKNGIQLNWATATEHDNQYFIVEKSSDGKKFLPIAQIAGAGHSNILTRYEYLDETAGSLTNYYRLRQVDMDNTYEYSKIIAVKAGGRVETVKVQAYPNPTSGLLHLELAGQSGETTVEVRDLRGHLAWKTQLDPTARPIHTVDLGSLPAGLYLIQVKTPEQQHTTRVVKK